MDGILLSVGFIFLFGGLLLLIFIGMNKKIAKKMKSLGIFLSVLTMAIGLSIFLRGAILSAEKFESALNLRTSQIQKDFRRQNIDIQFDKSVLQDAADAANFKTADTFELFYKGQLRTIMKIEDKKGYFYEVPQSEVRPDDDWKKIYGHYIVRVKP